jgi:hypothetical protein
VAEPGLHALSRAVLHFLERASAGVIVAVGAVSHLAAEQLVQRQPRTLAEDVPQRDVDTAHRVEQHRPVAPVRADVHRLVDVLDLVDPPADEKGPQVLLDSGLHHERTLRERRTPPAVQARLIGDDLHHDQADAIGRREDDLDVLDPDRRYAARRRRRRRLGLHVAFGQPGCGRQHRTARKLAQHVTSLHIVSVSQSNCDRARLIDQILTRARADSGQIALASAPVDIGALASSLVEQIQPKSETRGIAPSCEQQEDVVVGSRRVIRRAGAGSTFTVTLPTARAVHQHRCRMLTERQPERNASATNRAERACSGRQTP